MERAAVFQLRPLGGRSRDLHALFVSLSTIVDLGTNKTLGFTNMAPPMMVQPSRQDDENDSPPTEEKYDTLGWQTGVGSKPGKLSPLGTHPMHALRASGRGHPLLGGDLLEKFMKLKRLTRMGLSCLCAAVLSAGLIYAGESAATRLKTSATVLREIMAAPGKTISRDLLEDSQCIVIVPGMKKGAFIVGGNYGRGFLLCRQPAGNGWSAPAGVNVEGGSFGFQIGCSGTDVIMLVMNKRGAEKLLSSKFTLGADASVAAGPVGRTSPADTELKMNAEILTYSRVRGVFAGVSLNGATLRPDDDSNAELYHTKQTNQEIVMGNTTVSAAASQLRAELDKYSARKEANK
jgi:lipid-binding SYLF domain-containing protein